MVKELVEDVNRIKTQQNGVGNANKYIKNLIKVTKRVRNQMIKRIKKINHKRMMPMNSKILPVQ